MAEGNETPPDRFYFRPDDDESDEAVAKRMADWAIAAVNSARAEMGLPPIPE
jgi:hypothetical protein